MGGANVGGFAVGDDGKLRQETVVVEQKVDFYRALSRSVLGPVKHLRTEVDEGAVQAEEFARK